MTAGARRSGSPLPSRTDAVAAQASRAIGGQWGRHAGVARGSWWTPLRWLLLMCSVTLLLAAAQKAPCAGGDWVPQNTQYTHMCYSDVVPLWNYERLDTGAVPFRDTDVEYPVLTGGVMWLTAGLTRGVDALLPGHSETLEFGLLTQLLLGLCGLLVTAATAQTARGRPWDATIFALSPLLVLQGFTNWDLLAMALTAGGLWAWSRQRPVLAGLLLGLGVAAKLYPLFVLLAIGILAWRTRRVRQAGWAAAAALAAWLATNVPVAIVYPHGWWAFYRYSLDRPAERSTIWAIARTAVDGRLNGVDTVVWRPPGFVVALVVIAALAVVAGIARAAPRRPRLAPLAFLCVLAFLLTTKVWSPQYSLWLLPLLALARPRWRLALAWQAAEIAVWLITLTLLLGFSVPGHGIAYGWLAAAVIVRDVLLLIIAGAMVREMWCPWLDVVRAGGADDPGGGVFDGAPDPAPISYADPHAATVAGVPPD